MFDRVTAALELEKLKDPFDKHEETEKQSSNKSEPMITNQNESQLEEL